MVAVPSSVAQSTVIASPGVAVAGSGVSVTVNVAVPPSATLPPPAMSSVNDRSSSSMVPVADASPKVAPDVGPLRVTVKVSRSSGRLSSIRAMVILAARASAGNVTVPVAAVKSEPEVALPLPVV